MRQGRTTALSVTVVFNSRPDTVGVSNQGDGRIKIKRGKYSVNKNGADRNETGSLKISVD